MGSSFIVCEAFLCCICQQTRVYFLKYPSLWLEFLLVVSRCCWQRGRERAGGGGGVPSRGHQGLLAYALPAYTFLRLVGAGARYEGSAAGLAASDIALTRLVLVWVLAGTEELFAWYFPQTFVAWGVRGPDKTLVENTYVDLLIFVVYSSVYVFSCVSWLSVLFYCWQLAADRTRKIPFFSGRRRYCSKHQAPDCEASIWVELEKKHRVWERAGGRGQAR